MPTTTRRKTPRFKTGQRVRVISKCKYYPDDPKIPNTIRVNRWAFIKDILDKGRTFGVTIPGYPNVIDYSVRELRARSTR